MGQGLQGRVVTLTTVLQLPRLLLLVCYVGLVVQGCPWWGVPCLCLFVLGWGCQAPAVHITQVRP
jgi:hypothetical protein